MARLVSSRSSATCNRPTLWNSGSHAGFFCQISASPVQCCPPRKQGCHRRTSPLIECGSTGAWEAAFEKACRPERLPSLFTDIAGSTTLLQRLGDRQPDWDEQAFEREVAEVRATH